MLAIFLQGLCAFYARLARGNTQIQHFARGKQRQRLCAVAQLCPLETGVGNQHLAFTVTGIACRGAYRIGRLDRQQHGRAMYHIERLQAFA